MTHIKIVISDVAAMFTNEELQKIDDWKQKEIAKVEASNIPEDKKQEKIELIESTEFHRIGPELETGKCNHNLIEDESNHMICTHCGLGFQTAP